MDKDYIVSWQTDLENTKESKLPVCDKPYHKIKENMPLGEELEKCGTIHCIQGSPTGRFKFWSKILNKETNLHKNWLWSYFVVRKHKQDQNKCKPTIL